jgi:hypothetical protein
MFLVDIEIVLAHIARFLYRLSFWVKHEDESEGRFGLHPLPNSTQN